LNIIDNSVGLQSPTTVPATNNERDEKRKEKKISKKQKDTTTRHGVLLTVGIISTFQ
jgi:hypothetical protein